MAHHAPCLRCPLPLQPIPAPQDHFLPLKTRAANNYVSYYAQRISSACVMNVARGMLKSIAVQRNRRRVAAAQAV